MLIVNTENRVLQARDAVYTATFLPGDNVLADARWDALKTLPFVQKRLASGALVEAAPGKTPRRKKSDKTSDAGDNDLII